MQHVPRLRELFREVDVWIPRDTVVRRPGRVGQVRYFATHAKRYIDRGVAVRRLVGGYEALLIQRGLYAMGPGAIVASLRGYAGRVVFDLDDAVTELSPSLAGKRRLAHWLYGPQQSRRLLSRADEIVVSTNAIAELLPAWAPVPTILPTVPDPSQYAVVEPRDRRPAVIGWTGNIGGIRFLDPLTDVFRGLAQDGLGRLEVVSAAAWKGPATFRRWRLHEAAAAFSDFDIGIMPLTDTPYTRAKAGFKLLEYMAAGLPVVASPIGVNTELVVSSGAGFLAAHPSEWDAALRELAKRPDLRRQMGRSGRAFVERYADLEAQAKTLARLLVGTAN